jgi:hypothetical protein
LNAHACSCVRFYPSIYIIHLLFLKKWQSTTLSNFICWDNGVGAPSFEEKNCDFPSFSNCDISNHALGMKMQGQNHNRPKKQGH